MTDISISPIKNYSKRILTTEETTALENGLDFVFPSIKFDQETFIANVETLFVNLMGHCSDKHDYDERDIDEKISYNLTPEQLSLSIKLRKICDTFRQQALRFTSKYKREIGPVIKTLKSLSNDKSIYITRADKGHAVVILDRKDYINKMETILNNSETFIQLDEDPTIYKEDKLQKKLLHLKNAGFLTDAEYKYVRPVGSQPGKAYGLPKIHKQGIPLRPIISACNTFTYKLSKLLSKKLKHLRTSPTIITDTFKFVNDLHNLKLDTSKMKMISFDIVSLFTRVPLLRTIDLILDQMYESPHTCIFSNNKQEDWCKKCQQRYELKWLLEISTKDSHFTFNGKMYCQVKGIAMGSPLGPLFADIYVNYLESKLKQRLEQNGVIYWRRFVDDCFVLIKEEADVNRILEILNSFDVDIQFTSELEENNSLPFLDILITRTTNDLLTNSMQLRPFSTSIFRKPTFTGLLLKWNSHVPHTYKVSMISSMVYRAIKICSSYSLMHKEFEYIQNLAVENGYPLKFVEYHIRKTLNREFDESKIKKENVTTSTDLDNSKIKKTQIFIDLPFIGKETKTLGKKVINLVKNVRPDLHIQPIPRPPPSVGNFFPQKDKIQKDAQSNIVYLISCRNCNENYIGKTVRQASRRHHEHGAPQRPKEHVISSSSDPSIDNKQLRRSNRLKNKLKVDYTFEENERKRKRNLNREQLLKSALYKHQINANHTINWSEWKILSKDSNRYRLLIRESLQILQRKPSLNRTTCSIPLIVYPEGLQSPKPTVKLRSTLFDEPLAGTNS